MADINNIFSKEALDSIEKVNTGLMQIYETTMKLGQTLEVNMSKAAKGAGTAAEKTTALNEAETKAAEIAAQQAKAEAELEKQRQKGYQAMAKVEAKERELYDAMNKEAKTVDELRKQNKALLDARNKINTTTAEGQKQIAELNKRLDENNKAIKSNVSALEKQKIGIGQYEEGIISALKKMGPFGSALASGAETMKKYTTATEGAAAANQVAAVSANVGTKAMKILKIALISTGIGALIVAVGALYEYFTKTERGAMALKVVIAQFKAVIDVIVDRVIMLGEGLYKIFTGQFKAGWTEMRNAFNGIGEEMANEVTQSKELAIVENNLVKLRRESNEQIAKNRLLIQQELETARDTTIAAEKRNEALGKARAATKENVELIKQLNAIEIDNLEKKTAMAESNTDDFNALSELKVQSYANETQAQTELNTLIKLQSTITKQLVLDREANAHALDVEQSKLLEINKLKGGGIEELKVAEEERAGIIIETRKTVDEYLEDAHKAEMDRIQKENEAKIQSAMDYVNMVAQIGDQLLSFNQFRLDQEKADLEQHYQFETQLAGDNAAEKEKIDAKYDKERAKLKRKQDKQDKEAALFKAIIGTAMATIAGFATTPFFPLGLAMGILAGTLGTIQVLKIASQPLPQYAKGTKSAKSGLAWVGEKGSELIYGKDGSIGLSPSTATLMDMGKGGQTIIPNRETRALFSAAKGADDPNSRRMLDMIHSDNERLINTIRNKSELHIYDSGNKITERKGDYYKHYMNKKLGIKQ